VSFFTQARRQPAVGIGLLVVIMRRRCLDFWRRRYRRTRRETPWDDLTEKEASRHTEEGDRYCEGLEDGLRIASIWNHLSERCRHALARRFWMHETAAEAAVRVGQKPESYKRMVSRCLGALRQKFEECA